MAGRRVERKAFYVGTWREDTVTDDTMRQIVARCLAEKGQKVKVRVSESGLVVSRSGLLLQESVVTRQPLQDVYFLTVNQQQPCCLLCIVADPVKKFLIVALRTATAQTAQDLVSTFEVLKNNPGIKSGNVVLRRKDNGNWTLRERSQHNANRHLQEIFLDAEEDGDAPTGTPAGQRPNGSAGGTHVTTVIGSGRVEDGEGEEEKRYRLVPEGGVMVVTSRSEEVEGLSQDLQDVKLVVENSGLNNNNDDDDDTDKSYYIETQIVDNEMAAGPEHQVVTIVSPGNDLHPHPQPADSDQPGGVRVVVEDHRQDGVVRAHSTTAQPSLVQPTVMVRNGERLHDHRAPAPIPVVAHHHRHHHQHNNSSSSSQPSWNAHYSEIPDYKIQRHVSTEYVQVPDFSRKVHGARGGSLRSNLTTASRVSFDPELKRRRGHKSGVDPKLYGSLKTFRVAGVPTTVVRPIEEVYGGHYPARPLLHHVVKRPPGGGSVYAAPSPAGELVYVPTAAGGNPHPPSRVVRRSRPNSIHVMEGNELKVFYKTSQQEDILF